MIGDAKIPEAEFHRFAGHRFERVVAVGGGGVVVEGAAELGELDETRQAPLGGGLDFAAVFAELGWDEIEAESIVDFGFLVDFRENRLAVGNRCHGGEAVFVEREALLESKRADGDVVFLGAGKVLKGEGKLGVRDGAQIALEAVLQSHGGFRFAAGDDGGHLRQRGEILADEGGLLGRDKEIEVMHGFLGAAVRAGGGDPGYLRVEAQKTGDFLDQRGDAAEKEGVGEVFPQGDGFEDFHLRLRAEAGEPGDPAGLAGGLEIGDRRDREHLVQCLDLLRPEALQVE